MPTIYEVAKRARVSAATVSRILNRPSVGAPATRRRVLQAVERLSYTPNSTAANLRTLRTGKLLVTLPDLSNPYFSLILQGIEDAAQRAGYSVLVGDAQHDRSREERYALMLRRKEADGLIFFGNRLPREVVAIAASMAPRRVPVVTGVCKFKANLDIPGVHIDNVRAAYQALDYLCSLGHRRIGIVTGPRGTPISRDRWRGVNARARKDRCVIAVVEGDFSIDSGIRAATVLLDRPGRPTAVFCFNDEMAIGVIEAARARGLAVPRDLSVVGFDDIRFARHTHPPLTTIAQPMREIGEATVRLLLGILNGVNGTAPASITLPHRLIVRGSTAPPIRPSSLSARRRSPASAPSSARRSSS
jgi:LacI family repressor for deo operon, udp, cdd, tsx, nupC, and nupG